MPLLDGFHATIRIRQSPIPQVRDVVILALTASAIAGDRERFLSAGMNGYLSKVRPILSRFVGRNPYPTSRFLRSLSAPKSSRLQSSTAFSLPSPRPLRTTLRPSSPFPSPKTLSMLILKGTKEISTWTRRLWRDVAPAIPRTRSRSSRQRSRLVQRGKTGGASSPCVLNTLFKHTAYLRCIACRTHHPPLCITLGIFSRNLRFYNMCFCLRLRVCQDLAFESNSAQRDTVAKGSRGWSLHVRSRSGSQ